MPGFAPEVARRGCIAAAQENRRLRQEHDASLLPVIVELRAQGMSLQEIGTQLTLRGFVTRQGLHYWDRRQVLRILRRAEEASAQAVSNGGTLPEEVTVEAVTLPEDGSAETVTLPDDGALESVTPPVVVQVHGVQMAVTDPSSDGTPGAKHSPDDGAATPDEGEASASVKLSPQTGD
jgi:hypothetical protein